MTVKKGFLVGNEFIFARQIFAKNKQNSTTKLEDRENFVNTKYMYMHKEGQASQLSPQAFFFWSVISHLDTA